MKHRRPSMVWARTTIVLSTLLLGCSGAGAEPADEEAADGPIGTTVEAYSLSSYWWNLPWRGGSGGTWTGPMGCQAGDVIVGLHGRGGTYVDQIGLICAKLYANGTFGPRYTLAPQGGGGGDPFYLQCPEGTAAVSIEGRAKTYLDRIDMACSQPPFTPSVVWYAYRSGDTGGDGGEWFTDRCPKDYVLRTIEMRVGSLVDAIRGNCNYVYP